LSNKNIPVKKQMQTNINQEQYQNLEIDSTGSIYSQSYDNLPLSNQFLEIKFINFSQKTNAGKTTTVKISNEKKSKLNELSFKYSDFVLVLLLSLFALIAFVRLSGKNYFNRLLMSIQNYSYSVSFFREKNLAYVLYNNILIFVFFVSCGILSTMIAAHYGISIPNMDKFLQLLIFTIIIAFLVFLNRFMARVSGIIFGYYKITAEYLFYYANWLRIVGVLLLILCLILSFVNPNYQNIFIYLTFFVLVITYLVKSLRIFIIFFTNRLSLYYLILYFCALEIIPFILLLKLIVLIIQNKYSFSGILV
jgi:hypothetical protein